ncbi:MAG: heme biosynthesis HemY N-terminal domain-containing protein [Oxalobacteraceae bacterium]
MRFFIWLLILFASAIGLAVLARFNPGNVVLFYPPYRVDLSLNFFIVLLVVVFALLLTMVTAIRATLAMPRRVEQYRATRQLRESGRALNEALQSFLEGRFGRSEKLAERALLSPDHAGLAALIGARAAQRLQQPSRRDDWLEKAQIDDNLRTARLMTTVELLAEDVKETDVALEALQALNNAGIRHTQALKLALKVHQNARNWPEVLRLVRLLDKHKSLHPALSRRLRDMAYEALMPKASEDPESLKLLWSKVPTEDRNSAVVAVQAANAFMKIGQQIEAAAIIESALAAQWDSRLLRAYRQCAAPEGSATLLKQIEHCEHWLRERPNDTEIALALGVLCFRQKLWGKAQRHLEQSLLGSDLATRQEAHLRLAQLHEALSQTEAAAEHYRRCALITQPTPP